MPEIISKIHDTNGKEYKDHLFIDRNTGTASIKLNNWEEGVLSEEQKRDDFVCWLRNFSQQNWALCIPYDMDNNKRSMYPDFLIIRRDEIGYIVDILEPHDPSRRDNLAKAKGLANYAKENPGAGRIQLIRGESDKKFFKRLDMNKSAITNKVLKASTNKELDNIFDSDGQID